MTSCGYVFTCKPVCKPTLPFQLLETSHTPIKNDTQNICMKSTYPMTDLAYLPYLTDMYSSIFHKRGRETSINPSYLIAAIQFLQDMLMGQL